MHIPSQSLKNKVALVTGAGSGIGKATAKTLAHAGAAVVLVGTTLDKLQETEQEITDHDGAAFSVEADITNKQQMKAAADMAIERWGRLDILHHNAGINGVWAPFEDFTEPEWDETVNVNLKGTFVTLQSCYSHIKKQGGSVIVTSSVNGTRMFSNSGASIYACTKAGQVALVKMLAVEWARSKVRINVICPGAIDTPIHHETEERNLDKVRLPVEFPEGRIPLKKHGSGNAGDVAQLVWFLASDAASHITGTEIYIDGAQSLFEG